MHIDFLGKISEIGTQCIALSHCHREGTWSKPGLPLLVQSLNVIPWYRLESISRVCYEAFGKGRSRARQTKLIIVA